VERLKKGSSRRSSKCLRARRKPLGSYNKIFKAFRRKPHRNES
jgi:hypothetical protein